MTKYTATVEVDNKAKLERAAAGSVLMALQPFDGVIGQHEQGWWSATMTVTADSLGEATVTAIDLVEAAYSRKALSCEVLPLQEYLVRRGYPPDIIDP